MQFYEMKNQIPIVQANTLKEAILSFCEGEPYTCMVHSFPKDDRTPWAEVTTASGKQFSVCQVGPKEGAFRLQSPMRGRQMRNLMIDNILHWEPRREKADLLRMDNEALCTVYNHLLFMQKIRAEEKAEEEKRKKIKQARLAAIGSETGPENKED